jgi:hypothetical protein
MSLIGGINFPIKTTWIFNFPKISFNSMTSGMMENAAGSSGNSSSMKVMGRNFS